MGNVLPAMDLRSGTCLVSQCVLKSEMETPGLRDTKRAMAYGMFVVVVGGKSFAMLSVDRLVSR